MLKRSLTEELYPGMWQILTGKIKQSEKATHAALRELREETGLAAHRFWVAPIVGSFFDPRENSVQLCPLFAAEVGSADVPVLSIEHDEYEWASAAKARKLLVWPGHLDAVQIVENYIVANREAASLTEIKQFEKGT